MWPPTSLSDSQVALLMFGPLLVVAVTILCSCSSLHIFTSAALPSSITALLKCDGIHSSCYLSVWKIRLPSVRVQLQRLSLVSVIHLPSVFSPHVPHASHTLFSPFFLFFSLLFWIFGFLFCECNSQINVHFMFTVPTSVSFLFFNSRYIGRC